MEQCQHPKWSNPFTDSVEFAGGYYYTINTKSYTLFRCMSCGIVGQANKKLKKIEPETSCIHHWGGREERTEETAGGDPYVINTITYPVQRCLKCNIIRNVIDYKDDAGLE